MYEENITDVLENFQVVKNSEKNINQNNLSKSDHFPLFSKVISKV